MQEQSNSLKSRIDNAANQLMDFMRRRQAKNPNMVEIAHNPVNQQQANKEGFLKHPNTVKNYYDNCGGGECWLMPSNLQVAKEVATIEALHRNEVMSCRKRNGERECCHHNNCGAANVNAMLPSLRNKAHELSALDQYVERKEFRCRYCNHPIRTDSEKEVFINSSGLCQSCCNEKCGMLRSNLLQVANKDHIDSWYQTRGEYRCGKCNQLKSANQLFAHNMHPRAPVCVSCMMCEEKENEQKQMEKEELMRIKYGRSDAGKEESLYKNSGMMESFCYSPNNYTNNNVSPRNLMYEGYSPMDKYRLLDEQPMYVQTKKSLM